MMLYKVTSVAFDPDCRTAYYTEDNYAFRDLHGGQCRHRPKADAAAGRAHRRYGRQPGGQVDLGHPPRERPGDDRPDPAALCRLQSDPHVQIWRRCRSTSTSRPTATKLSASFGEINGTQSVRVWKSTRCRQMAIRPRLRGSTCRRATPEGLHLHARREVAVRNVLLHRRVERLPVRHRDAQKYDAVSNASTGFFRPMPQPDGSLIAYEYQRPGTAAGALPAEGPE